MAMLIFLLLALPILFILSQKLTKKQHFPPGPKGLPILGNLNLVLEAGTTPLHLNLYKLSQKYGEIMSLNFGFRKAVVVSSAKTAELVLKTHDTKLCSRPQLLGLKTMSYNGFDVAFGPYTPYWRESRKISVVHLFNLNRVQSFKPLREHEVSLLVKKISGFASQGKAVDLLETMVSFSSGLICKIAFGKKYEDDGVEKSVFSNLTLDTQKVLMGFFFSDYLPGFGFVDRLTGSISFLNKTFRNFDDFLGQVVAEHLDPNRPKSQQEDFMDVLLGLYSDRSFKVEFTMDQIKAIVMNVILGGIDTTSATIVWAMTYLMQNPTSMAKVQDEIRSKIGKKGFVNEEDISQLPYLNAVIKETWRIQPVLPLLVPREALEDCKLEGYDIKAKTIVYVNAYAIGRDPKIWDNPAEFRPERFIGSSVDYKGNDYELIPFGSGRRICPGLSMGVASLELALANMLYKFNWEMPSGMKREDLDFEGQFGIVLHKKNPLCLVPSVYI